MLAELAMDLMGWEAAWSPGLRRGRLGTFLRRRWFVGTWTGRGGDLLCVRATAEEDPRHLLSPPGRSLLHAALLSLWRAWRTR